MLFDLRGRRRRAVQATYLTLAILMGGGLVFFGIGGDVSGGLFDAFSERGGGNDPGSAIEKRIERNEKRLRTQPENKAILAELVRDEFSLATSQTRSNSTSFPREARDELRKAGQYWERYLKAEPKNPDPSLASVALQVYDVSALNKPKDAQRAAAIIAEEEGDAASYLRLVQYAGLAGDTRTADLAAQKAVDVAPKSERKTVKQQAEQLKNPQAQQQPQG
jgi:hypothetical protein